MLKASEVLERYYNEQKPLGHGYIGSYRAGRFDPCVRCILTFPFESDYPLWNPEPDELAPRYGMEAKELIELEEVYEGMPTHKMTSMFPTGHERERLAMCIDWLKEKGY